jgi:membrane dipeptidase
MIFDAHLDLAMNALEWNRDLRLPLGEIRRREIKLSDKPDRGRATVSFPELRRGGVGLCVATQIARIEHQAYSPVFGWASPEQAWAQTQGQLAWYRAMEEAGELVQIRDAAGLERQLSVWPGTSGAAGGTSVPGEEDGGACEAGGGVAPIGYLLSLEGADSILTLDHLGRAYQSGLRALGPAHYGPGVYANGTDSTGGFNPRGRELLREMDRLGLILDVTHLCDDSFWEALELYEGAIWASHSNCRTLVPHHRQFDDRQLRALVERGAVIGAALDGWMLVPEWVRGQTTPEAVNLRLERVVDHIDHVCQIAGTARHSGIGSDLDGGFGCEQTPRDVQSIADLAQLSDMLGRRGYSPADIEGIMSGNFVRFLREAWGGCVEARTARQSGAGSPHPGPR